MVVFWNPGDFFNFFPSSLKHQEDGEINFLCKNKRWQKVQG